MTWCRKSETAITAGRKFSLPSPKFFLWLPWPLPVPPPPDCTAGAGQPESTHEARRPTLSGGPKRREGKGRWKRSWPRERGLLPVPVPWLVTCPKYLLRYSLKLYLFDAKPKRLEKCETALASGSVQLNKLDHSRKEFPRWWNTECVRVKKLPPKSDLAIVLLLVANNHQMA